MMYTFSIKGRIEPCAASKEAIRAQLVAQMDYRGWGRLPAKTPLLVSMHIAPIHRDYYIDDLIRAILDAMTGIVFPDARWIDELSVKQVERVWLPRLDSGPLPHFDEGVWVLVNTLEENGHRKQDKNANEFIESLE